MPSTVAAGRDETRYLADECGLVPLTYVSCVPEAVLSQWTITVTLPPSHWSHVQLAHNTNIVRRLTTQMQTTIDRLTVDTSPPVVSTTSVTASQLQRGDEMTTTKVNESCTLNHSVEKSEHNRPIFVSCSMLWHSCPRTMTHHFFLFLHDQHNILHLVECQV